MAGTGPTPNPGSRRQAGTQAHTWTDLPAEGYQGGAPDWPIGAATDAELAMWSRYWRKPQASAWAAMMMVDEIALYVRTFLAGVSGDVKATTEARQMADRLGLNPTAMLKNRWRIKSDDLAEKRETKTPVKKSPRERLKVVASDGVASS